MLGLRIRLPLASLEPLDLRPGEIHTQDVAIFGGHDLAQHFVIRVGQLLRQLGRVGIAGWWACLKAIKIRALWVSL